MAHFAKLDEANNVLAVDVIVNSVITDENGVEQEQLGIDFLTELYGAGNYVQTSYNNTIRKQYASIGGTYDSAKDKFIQPQPYPSWALDGNDDWQAPIAYPDDGNQYVWDEANQRWTNTN